MTMKLRNRLIALLCLIIFLILGAALFLGTAPRKPFAVILFVGDNLNPSALAAARLFAGGGDARLQMEDFPNTALCRNPANDYSIPDKASASTSLASGKRVNSGSLCIDPSGAKLASLLDEATKAGRSTGLVTTGEITDVGPAAFYAKTAKGHDATERLNQFLAHPPLDFAAGEGPAAESFQKLTAKGVAIINSMNDLENQPFWKKSPTVALLSKNTAGTPGQDSASPSLPDLVRIAIRQLQGNRHGYLLVVEDASIAEAAAINDGESMFKRLLAFDQAVATARRYAGENSLIVVAGRENVGGLTLNGYPLLRDKGVAILALNAQGNPSLCWSTGPGYSTEEPRDPFAKKTNARPGILSQPSAFPLPRASGAGGDVLGLGIGDGSEKIHGFLDLTDLHGIISEKL